MPPLFNAQLGATVCGALVIGETWTPRQRLRAVQAAAALSAVAIHVLIFSLVRPDPHLRDRPPADEPPIIVSLVRPPKPPEAATPADRPTAARRDRAEDEERASRGPNPRDLPSLESLAPPAGPPRNPGPPASQRTPGVVWGGGDPVQDAAQRALRGAAGCGLDIPLTRREQNGCDERMGRDWRDRGRGRPLMADRARQRELEDQAEYRMRRKEYREAPPPAGLFEDLRDMGGKAPRK